MDLHFSGILKTNVWEHDILNCITTIFKSFTILILTLRYGIYEAQKSM
jgi:hypothetical protein